MTGSGDRLHEAGKGDGSRAGFPAEIDRCYLAAVFPWR
ncbi:MAG: hypothetical protein FAZ92_03192 [Accumulibacter sp.]|nr:MAG: hypothetical protein FAZ92_03192 [Accumulibacter sp.]